MERLRDDTIPSSSPTTQHVGPAFHAGMNARVAAVGRRASRAVLSPLAGRTPGAAAR